MFDAVATFFGWLIGDLLGSALGRRIIRGPMARQRARAVEELAVKHPDATVRPAHMLSWRAADTYGRDAVVAILADHTGLSFRDAYDHDELRIPVHTIVAIETVASAPAQDHIRIRLANEPVDFWSASTGEGEAEVVAALRAAIAP